jgi:hypothetical protein
LAVIDSAALCPVSWPFEVSVRHEFPIRRADASNGQDKHGARLTWQVTCPSASGTYRRSCSVGRISSRVFATCTGGTCVAVGSSGTILLGASGGNRPQHRRAALTKATHPVP